MVAAIYIVFFKLTKAFIVIVIAIVVFVFVLQGDFDGPICFYSLVLM